MNPDSVLSISTAPRRDSRHWKGGTVTWGEILEWLEDPANKKECGNYVLGVLGACPCTTTVCRCPGRDCDHLVRGKATIVSRSGITLDVDKPRPDFVENTEMLLPSAAIIHTTYSSSPDAMRYRVIIPISRDLTPEEYHRAVLVLMRRLGEKQFDPGSVQPERYMYRPSAQEPDWFGSWVLEGDPLDVEEVLASYDPSDFPLRDPKPHRNKRDPFDLAGVVGAFNRVYQDFQELIEAYELPYEAAGALRWHLVGATSPPGMGIIDEGLVYSHHVTDPAGGQTCTAFDLVRLHRFGSLDSPADEARPVNRRPSHEAMLDLAMHDNRVMAEMVGSDFDKDLAPEVGTDWKLHLSLSARTGKILDIVANWDLIREHDPVFQKLLFNEMTLAVEVDSDLPWRPLSRGGETFSGPDRAELRMHLEREYSMDRPPASLIDDLIETKARQRWVNPVRDYLLNLRWDGKRRLEECLPGVRPTMYTRLVARKSLVAAVARMLDPGIKWDHTLILFGDEGLGKSYWIDKMARGWSSSLGRIGDKDTLLTMQRTWIMISDEGHSLRKADHDAQKEFLTRTVDVFRMPFDRESLAHPRHCVIWGTTNDEIFLRRQEGNRRFLIVKCEEKVDFDALTDEYIDQVWAEAVHYYRGGERLFLTDAEAALAGAEREQYVEEDALGGVIQEFLNTRVPEDWDLMSPESRMMFMMNASDGMASGTVPITRTCSAQIWVEALGRRLGDHRRSDLLDIANALSRMPGWHPKPGRHRVSGYGPQLVFERDGTSTEPEDDLI